MKIRSPKHNARGTIDCEIEHPEYGWIPFTASPDDVEEHGREIYQKLISGEAGDIAEYIPQQLPTYEELVAYVEAARKEAYANAQTGSDRLFAEAQRMQMMGIDGWEEVRDKAIARYNEIKEQNPYPTE